MFCISAHTASAWLDASASAASAAACWRRVNGALVFVDIRERVSGAVLGLASWREAVGWRDEDWRVRFDSGTRCERCLVMGVLFLVDFGWGVEREALEALRDGGPTKSAGAGRRFERGFWRVLLFLEGVDILNFSCLV